MRLHLLIIALLTHTMPVFSQKPALDTNIFRDWPKVGLAKISHDGKFVAYEIQHIVFGQIGWKETVLQSTQYNWNKVFTTVTSDVTFSNDGKKAYCILSNDSLAIVTLGTDDISIIKGVNAYRLTDHYLVYKSSDILKAIDLANDKELEFTEVTSFEVYNNRDALLLSCKMANGRIRLAWCELLKNKIINIWEGDIAEGFIYNEPAGSIVFVGGYNGDKALWHYHAGDKRVSLLVNNSTAGFDSLLLINRVYKYSHDGRLIYFVAEPREQGAAIKEQPAKAKVTIWSYNDEMLQSEQQIRGTRRKEYVYETNVNTGKITLIAGENEEITGISNANDYVVLRKFSGSGGYEEADWNPYSQEQVILKSLKDAGKIVLPVNEACFSEKGKYLLYFYQGDYYTIELKSGRTINITRRLPKGECTGEYDYLSTWLDGDRSVIIYAKRDLWRIDPAGKEDPINLTNGYGNKHNMVFYPLEFDCKAGKQVVLSAYNLSNKENGFYKITWEAQQDPEKIIMDKAVYYSPHPQMENGYDNKPIKALGSGEWLVKKMSEKESPNYLITKDFKSFKQVTNIYPERKYNWMYTELHQWVDFEGDSLTGILYKPTDFDATKKYPVIFYYYEQFSENLHAYLDPGPAKGPINIPWFVSHGYVVFVPDIKYKPGQTGYSAYNAIVSAAQYISRQPYIDATRMGIQGHSFGGYETNYIITHSNIFRAACSASGISDLISMSGGIGALGQSLHFMVDKGQIRLHAKLWEDPDRFIKNSPLFYIDHISTPLLLMHTRNDRAVSFNQALELFNGMRMFRKKVWFLIYDDENHILRKQEDMMDYTERMDQFFNYYLKNGVEPFWMK